jgi:uncharacterized membrane protein
MAVSYSAASGLFEALKAAGPTRADSVRRMEAVAHVLDTAFLIPGTNQRVGIDAIIGLVPGIGDAVTTLLSTYVIWEARQLGLSRFAIARMLANLAVHASVGAIPVVGDVFDAFFRVNQRNMRIVRAHLARGPGGRDIDGTAVRVAERPL